jgi:rSAM/selenodomain-associated transferase 1
VVLAKAPQPGRVKTRLCPPLSPASATSLQRACLSDLWARLGSLRGVERVLCYDPPDAAALFRELLGADADLLPQPTGDLGQRLVAAFEALFARGLSPVVALGAASPDLPLSLVTGALAALAAGDCEVAIGPAADGGYTLVGLRQPLREPFVAIPWSTPAVLTTTLKRCRQAGLAVRVLDPWDDVDDAASLDRLRDRVLASPDELPQLRRFFELESETDPDLSRPRNLTPATLSTPLAQRRP